MKVSGGGHSGRGHRSHAVPMAEINIIPLVDVVLVLLIIFMATTAFVKESGLNMKLPAAKTTEVTPQENKDINIALTRNNKIYLDGKPTNEKAVLGIMMTRAKKMPDTRVIIKGDEKIEYKRVVQIMDMAKQAGLPKVALGTQLPDGKDQ
ncbi:MAG: biopolymer transporter ExbD [Abitibacteriaceae bacterium]|nr:biopolymer transporter ExbD [Abditibacteriaceae bacterium]